MHKEKIYKNLFDGFNNLKVMIIGDIMVDAYLWGKVDRISPEAPIPIVALKKRENRAGGAANVAMNIRSMGATPILCSVIGDDLRGEEFVGLLKKEKIPVTGILKSKNRITTTKFRIFGNNTQMLRVDEEVEHDLTQQDQQRLLVAIDKILEKQKIDCIIFQDYNKGVIIPEIIGAVVEHAKARKIPITVDPKKKNFELFKGVTLFKPNLKELKEGLKVEFGNDDRTRLMEVTHFLRKKLACEFILATLSEQGMLISMKDKIEERSIFIPAHVRTIADVSGAGDTVISVASLCLASKCSPYEIAYISNLAGGLVCEEVGVVPVNKEKLLKEVLALL
jgi:D-glycero-beta-D-manno-heptose-7-phosphate kinase